MGYLCTVEQIINEVGKLPKMARTLLEFASDRRIWVFSGDLGAGKTSLIKAICAELGSSDEITSPTFSLVNEYKSSKGTIYHLDLYRLKDLDEALNIGIEEYLDSGNFCLIEWPEVIEPLWPENVLKINIEILNISSRKILFL